jgi:hypothetical protein
MIPVLFAFSPILSMRRWHVRLEWFQIKMVHSMLMQHFACTDPCRPPIPIHVAHLFRDMPPTDSARMTPTFLLNPERNQKTV